MTIGACMRGVPKVPNQMRIFLYLGPFKSYIGLYVRVLLVRVLCLQVLASRP